MKIRGLRVHLGDRLKPRVGGRIRLVGPLQPRPSADPELVVIWYPHRDAPSLLADDLSHTGARSASRRRVGVRPAADGGRAGPATGATDASTAGA